MFRDLRGVGIWGLGEISGLGFGVWNLGSRGLRV